VEPAGDFTLKGYRQQITAFNVVAVREPAGTCPLWRARNTL
jgi:hypothetical protein